MTLSWPLEQINAQNENVRSIQYFLNAHGQAIAVDGIFGTQTQGAVRTFQAAHGLGVDGIVGNQTWPALIIQTASGSQGDAVRAVQSQANSRGAQDLTLDGSYGPLDRRRRPAVPEDPGSDRRRHRRTGHLEPLRQRVPPWTRARAGEQRPLLGLGPERPVTRRARTPAPLVSPHSSPRSGRRTWGGRWSGATVRLEPSITRGSGPAGSSWSSRSATALRGTSTRTVRPSSELTTSIGSGTIAAARTRAARCSRSGSERRSGRH